LNYYGIWWHRGGKVVRSLDILLACNLRYCARPHPIDPQIRAR
jgi:hypothetical protein